MISRSVYVCEKCSLESPDLTFMIKHEKSNHISRDSQFKPITKDIIESFRTRLLKLHERERKGYIDTPSVSLYYVLYGSFLAGHYTILESALTEVERLYEGAK